ncbi:MAG: hypothetical protein RLW68_07085 [Devosia marina]|uniref:hypothetical protein n=1 Tax=Devosia marina TaxID=2683198 RepID=UPI0032EDDE72
MATYTEQLQHIWRQYKEAGMPMPATARQVAGWAIENRLWMPRPEDVVTRCADDLARAWREDYRTDKHGRRYRTKHAVRVTKSGVQLAFWADIDTAPRHHMQRAFTQRRQQIVGDCYQLSVDVDVYNGKHPDEPPIQMVLDFNYDVEEMKALGTSGGGRRG